MQGILEKQVRATKSCDLGVRYVLSLIISIPVRVRRLRYEVQHEEEAAVAPQR